MGNSGPPADQPTAQALKISTLSCVYDRLRPAPRLSSPAVLAALEADLLDQRLDTLY
ncbi:MAG: hypothetical protein JW940_33460 [Polyangiaceae bacterium]|nr:hypothetical protein [Polyangiaceae bacterium]